MFMHEDYKKFFVFKVEGEVGNLEYYTFEKLPFGLKDVACTFVKLKVNLI